MLMSECDVDGFNGPDGFAMSFVINTKADFSLILM